MIYQENEVKKLILKLHDSRTDRFVNAKIYDSDLNLHDEIPLPHISSGIYAGNAVLSLGKFAVYYEVFTDSGFTTKDSSYVVTEEFLSIVPNNNEKIDELHKINGLDSTSPMTVTESSRTCGSITQNFTGDGISTTTVTRA